MTFSSTVRCGNVRTTWNVRPMPRRQSALGRRPVTTSPRNLTSPLSGTRKPFSTLKSVVLPAPFGPMTPRISRSRTSKLTSETATRPMNDLVTPRTSSSTVSGARPASASAVGAPASTERATSRRGAPRERTAWRTRQ